MAILFHLILLLKLTLKMKSSASNVVIEQITDGIGNTAVLQNVEAVRLYLGFDSSPSGAESITISPVSGSYLIKKQPSSVDKQSLI